MKKGKNLLNPYNIYGGFCIISGAATYTWGVPLIHDNEDATSIIVTVFSILAGFLIAIMTLLGDQTSMPGGWRISQEKRNNIKSKLIRQKYLFYLYLITLTLIFSSTLCEKINSDISNSLERIYFSLSVTAFLLSFRLPSTLMQIQMERMDALVAARRKSAPKIEQ